jgi:heat shock protein HslJ
MRLLISMLTLTLVLGACATSQMTALQDREWRLVWVERFDTMPAGAATPTIRFDPDGRMSGNTGCNSAGGSYAVGGDALRIENIVSTKRACAEPAGNELEAAYLSALERTRRFRIADRQLELLDAGGNVVARFN